MASVHHLSSNFYVGTEHRTPVFAWQELYLWSHLPISLGWFLYADAGLKTKSRALGRSSKVVHQSLLLIPLGFF